MITLVRNSDIMIITEMNAFKIAEFWLNLGYSNVNYDTFYLYLSYEDHTGLACRKSGQFSW